MSEPNTVTMPVEQYAELRQAAAEGIQAQEELDRTMGFIRRSWETRVRLEEQLTIILEEALPILKPLLLPARPPVS